MTQAARSVTSGGAHQAAYLFYMVLQGAAFPSPLTPWLANFRLQQLSSEVYGMRTELQQQQQTQSALLYSLCLLSGINLGLCACLIYLRRKQAT